MQDSVRVVSALRDTLTRLRTEDQASRDSAGLAVALQDTSFVRRQIRGDSARTTWLRAVVANYGWPRRSVFGDTAAEAAWLILQHSPSNEFREQMLPILENEASHGEVKSSEVAMLFDRIAVSQGRPQRYGTRFEVKGGRLQADPIADVAALDSLRASVGLPPMAAYVKLLEDMYRLPVVWPPGRPL